MSSASACYLINELQYSQAIFLFPLYLAVRLVALKMVAALMHEAREDEADSLFDIIYNRSRDRSLSVRKEVLAELAQVYKQNLQAAEPNSEKMTKSLNAILRMYYQPSIEDKWVIHG